MVQPTAIPARIAKSTAARLSTGSAPGRPMQTGQICVFGAAPNAVLQPQKIFDAVSSCAWTSRPMTASNDIGDDLVSWRVGDGEFNHQVTKSRTRQFQALGPAATTSAPAPCSN